jgi:DNA-binding transcriptional LysR family regulator
MIDSGGIVATRRLEAFLAVVEHAGFSRAADRLGISQPTVSQLVGALERAVGAPLLVRERGAVRPTPAGRALVPHATRLLADAEAAAEAVAAADRDARRHLRVAAGEALATHVLPPAVAALKARLPGLVATFVVGDEARTIEAVRSGEVDAALLTDRSETRDLAAHDYAPGRLVLVAAPGSAATRRGRLAAGDLADLTLVVRDAGTVNRREVEQMLASAGVEPASRLVASSLEAVKRCVEAGLGVTVVPSIAVVRELEEGRLVEVPLDVDGLDYRFRLCTRQGEALPPPVAALLDILRAGPPPPSGR